MTILSCNNHCKKVTLGCWHVRKETVCCKKLSKIIGYPWLPEIGAKAAGNAIFILNFLSRRIIFLLIYLSLILLSQFTLGCIQHSVS
ncbi:transmembrane protein, putative [Medicago truncatula]|uniref:Transmembrane protein, putative n=1 Tax=Medicago truncatula TaxID=3880 RepID=A0A072U0Z2_MEDTR|nr:transmembrane protein, putative [Medicago truncatula]